MPATDLISARTGGRCHAERGDRHRSCDLTPARALVATHARLGPITSAPRPGETLNADGVGDPRPDRRRCRHDAAGRGQRTVTRFQTETGSAYEVDLERMTWRRTPTFGSGVLRGESGPLLALGLDEVGRSAILLCPPFRVGGPLRTIMTSTVVAIEGLALRGRAKEP